MSCDEQNAPAAPRPREAGGSLDLQLRLPSDPRLLAVVRCTVAEFAAVCGFKDDQCRGITLAVDEALSNIIRHAYKNRCDQEIEMRLQASPECLQVTFIDRGEPVDRSKCCAQPLDAVALGGRGTHLIRQIMDEVCYERVPGGNRLRLKKCLPQARPTP
ncbi:MAG TPA: ATP-binding protein [Terriglobia bacterium]|nr:ATP-binding protein [Terriglobia bacterium]